MQAGGGDFVVVEIREHLDFKTFTALWRPIRAVSVEGSRRFPERGLRARATDDSPFGQTREGRGSAYTQKKRRHKGPQNY